MDANSLIFAWVIPLFLIPVWLRWQHIAIFMLASAPAILLALFVPIGSSASFDGLFLGHHLLLHAGNQPFLLASAIIWLAAGMYAAMAIKQDDKLRLFTFGYLLAMAGNFLLLLAADAPSFYIGYAMMGLSATLLILSPLTAASKRAARIYLIWTLLGELAIFTAIIMLVHDTGSMMLTDLKQADSSAAVLLILLGFGIKLALPGLHFWLIPVYTKAPTAAVIVLSGPMISAGFLGWLQFLPTSSPIMADYGSLLMVAGLFGMALSTIYGLLQRKPEAVLAYSSMGKMGFAAVIFAFSALTPDAAPALVPIISLFLLHHLVLKSSLFLIVGEWRRRGSSITLMLALAVLAFTLTGIPLTSGAAIKVMLQEIIYPLENTLAIVLAFSALSTALLMARLSWLLAKPPSVQAIPENNANHLVLIASAILAYLATISMTGFVDADNSQWLGFIIVSCGLLVAWFYKKREVPFSLPRVPPEDFLAFDGMARRAYRRLQHTSTAFAIFATDRRYLFVLSLVAFAVTVIMIGLLPHDLLRRNP